LSLFNDTTSLVVDGFAQLENKLFYQTLSTDTALKNGSNKMADGNTLFHSSHSNIAGTPAAISIDSLTAMRLLLRNMKAPGGSLLNLTAKYLIVGPNYEQLADQYTSANFVPVDPSKINKFGATLTPIVDARITDNRWFLMASPQAIPTVEVANLEGQAFYTESRYSFDVDGMEIKFRMTHGIKWIDFRGIVKNAGA
jgi:hypothetical protein